MWTPLQDLASNASTIRAQWETLDNCNCDFDWGWCEYFFGGYNDSPWMQDCFAYGSNTAPGPGIDQAVDELLVAGDPTAFQALILISDGLPCCGSQTTSRKQHAVDAVDRAWANGIHVWTVTFQNGGGDFSFLNSLKRGQGQAYLTPDSSQLSAIMQEIASSIPVVLVE